jgi:pimeloyl-ACP methyl ester carboxylesterase
MGLPIVMRGETGPWVLLFHGFALGPATYEPAARAIGRHARVVVPSLFRTRGRWTPGRCIDAIEATLNACDIDAAVLVAHSFGGGLALEVAARHPQRVKALVFVDTIALAERWRLAWHALPRVPFLYRLATPGAVMDGFRNWLVDPMDLLRAALWAFWVDRSDETEAVVRAGIESHVLWADADSILPVSMGAEFADRLNATFTVVSGPDGPVDHDWMYRRPELLVRSLRELGLL